MNANSIRCDAWSMDLREKLAATVDAALSNYSAKISMLTVPQLKYRMTEEWREFNQYVFEGRNMKFSNDHFAFTAVRCARLMNALLEIGDVISFAQVRYGLEPGYFHSVISWPVMDSAVLLKYYRGLYSKQFSDKKLFSDMDMWFSIHNAMVQVVTVQLAEITPNQVSYYGAVSWMHSFSLLLWAYKWSSKHKGSDPLVEDAFVQTSRFWSRLREQGVVYDPVLSSFCVTRREDGQSLDTEIDLPSTASIIMDEWH